MQFNAFLVRETANARPYRRVGEKQDEPDIWIPRSVIKHQTKWPAEEGKLPLCNLTIDDWFAEKNGL